MDEPYVHKIFIGKVKQMGDPHAKDLMDRQWESSMFKDETDDQIWLGKTGLTGDEMEHGEPEKAIFAYPIKHYTYWKDDLNTDSIDMGVMGENFAVLEMDEFTVCIGDTYKLGDAIIQVSQPKQPNWKHARRVKVIDFALQMQNSGRTGWYFRVLKEGKVLSRIDLELIDRPYPQWTIAACNEIMHVYKDDLRLADDLASCELLSENWRHILHRRLRGQESSTEKRLFGPNKE